MARGASERRERFFHEYEHCGDGVQAALRAGYSERMADFTARRLLREQAAHKGADGKQVGEKQAARRQTVEPQAGGKPVEGRARAVSDDDQTARTEQFRPRVQSAPAEPEGSRAACSGIEIVAVTRDMVLSGLYAEATSQGKESSQTCRVKAWELLARALGLIGAAGQAGQSDESVEPLVLRFDIHLDEPEIEAGRTASRQAQASPSTLEVQGAPLPGGRERERGRSRSGKRSPLSVLSSTPTGGGK